MHLNCIFGRAGMPIPQELEIFCLFNLDAF